MTDQDLQATAAAVREEIAALRERVRKLEAVAVAARRFDAALTPGEIWDAEDALDAALAQLDAPPRGEEGAAR